MNPSLNIVHLCGHFMEDKLIKKITVCMKELWEWFKKTVLLRLTLLEKDMLFSVHDINIQQLALEMYKVAKGLAPTATSSLFLQCSNNRRTRSQSHFLIPQVNTIYFGQNSIRYLRPWIWNSIQTASRNVESFVEFKSLIKNWKPSNYPCMLCKDYIPQVGFVNLTQ